MGGGALTHQRDPHAQGGSVDAEILQDVKAQKADHSQARPVAGVVELPGNPQTASQSGGQERTGAPGPGLGPEPLPVSQCTCWLRDLRQVTEWPSGLVFPFKKRGGVLCTVTHRVLWTEPTKVGTPQTDPHIPSTPGSAEAKPVPLGARWLCPGPWGLLTQDARAEPALRAPPVQVWVGVRGLLL